MTNNATEDEREKSEKQKTLIFIVNVRKKQCQKKALPLHANCVQTN